MAMSERDRRALMLGGTALGVLAVYFLGIEPLWGWCDDLAGAHQTRAARVARILADERKADYYAQRVAEFEEEVGGLSPPARYSEQITASSEKVVTAAKESGIELQNATPAAAVAWPGEPGFQQASIIVDGQGGWENVFKFIAALYRLDGILSVEQMELTSDPKKGGKMTVKLKVSVLVKAPEPRDDLWAK